LAAAVAYDRRAGFRAVLAGRTANFKFRRVATVLHAPAGGHWKT
jgi:hypothetical protein